MRSRKWLCGLTCAALLAVPNAAFAESADVSLYVNHAPAVGSPEVGQAYISDAGRTMVPLRLVADMMAYETTWQPDGTIRITNSLHGDGSLDVILSLGSTAYTAGGESGRFETAPFVKDGRTYLSARDFAEIGGSIFWDEATRSVWVFPEGTLDYTVLGKTLVRADGDVLTEVALPAGYEITDRGAATAEMVPIVAARTMDGATYLTVNVAGRFDGKLPLFRDDGDHLTHLTDVYGGASFAVLDDAVYYTEALGAGAWSPGAHPSWLYVTSLDDAQTLVYDTGFDVNRCQLDVQDGVVVARDGSTEQALDLAQLEVVR